MLETAAAIDFSTTWVSQASDDVARYGENVGSARTPALPPVSGMVREHETGPTARGRDAPDTEAGDVVLTTYWVAG
jgi:hypothetical protein